MFNVRKLKLLIFTLVLSTTFISSLVVAGETIELSLYYPQAVGGPITKLINEMTEDFHKDNPNIIVKPVYTGSYADTMVKSQTAFKANNPPDMAILSSTELFALLDMDMIIPLDNLFSKEYINDFYYGFLENGQTGGKTYSIPFQRSTQIVYYNKDAFKEVGLDPSTPPKNWDEVVEFGKKLTNEERWGLQIPSSAYTAWMFQGFALQNGKNLMSSDGKHVFFDTAENVEALKYWIDLSKKHEIMPEGIIDWSTVPSNFLKGNVAMIYHTTGNLANIRDNAEFEFGTAYLPAGNKGYGTPVGGGNIYIFKGIGSEREKAAAKFIEYVTQPEITAQWSIDTGYIATKKSAYKTNKMEEYLNKFPQAATARDQLEYASASISTHNNGEIQKILADKIQAALNGNLTPEEALKKAQKEAEKSLDIFNN
ncbi:MAG: ABC transporter substrate-binding protein [Bacillota bacterium]